jgi:microcystin-dependent protein
MCRRKQSISALTLCGMIFVNESYAQERCNLDDVINDKMDVTASLACIAKEIKYQQMPAGSVVAFSQKCPVAFGWSEYAEGAGKFILGAGQGIIRYRGPHRPDGAKESATLTSVDSGDQGGEEAHLLTIPEMPKHNHGGVAKEKSRNDTIDEEKGVGVRLLANADDDYSTGERGRADKTGLKINVSQKYKDQPQYTIETDGGDELHNNMPPYISLFFCKKD